jgi:hypothetical protein
MVPMLLLENQPNNLALQMEQLQTVLWMAKAQTFSLRNLAQKPN